MPFSTTYANNILNYLFSKTSTLSAPSRVWIGLCTNDPEASKGSFSELSGNGYARVLLHETGATFPNLLSTAGTDYTYGGTQYEGDRNITNLYQINWTKATADWSRVKGFGLFSAASGGTPFFYGALELTDEEAEAGGILCEAGSVMLFDPLALKISFPATDVTE